MFYFLLLLNQPLPLVQTSLLVNGVISATNIWDLLLHMLMKTFDIVTGHKRLLLFNKEHACKGPVYMYAQKETLFVSSQGWGKEEGQMLCQYLQCGNYKSHSNISKDNTHASNWWSKTYNCSGKMNMWECERNDQPVQLQQQLHIECDGRNHLSYNLLLFEGVLLK